MSFDSLLTHSAYVGRKIASTADTRGIPAVRYDFSITPFSCRIQAVDRNDARVAAGETADIVSTHRLFCHTSVVVSERDRIRFNGADYEVMFVDDAGGAGHHYEIDLIRVKP